MTSLLVKTSMRDFVIGGDQIRWVLMPDAGSGRILPSVMFDVEVTMERGRISLISLVGGGNGHGVGMCQVGAIGMAKRGYTYQMILSHYYPGCSLEKAY